MWTLEIIRARFIEAAATEAFLTATAPAQCRAFWPAFVHDAEDRKGWDDQAKLDNAQRWKGRAPDGAISRHSECMRWTADHIHDEKTRKIVWAFAFCRAYKRDFGKLCQKKGWVKTTAYNRLNRVWSRLADIFHNERLALELPAHNWLEHERPVIASIHATIGETDDAPSAIKFTPGYRTEPSRDLIRTQADADLFADFLAQRNADMRKAQEREAKRRQKLGLDAA